ncbi:MAG TPA: CAP domain-containing protein [Steroidobacteraceae bacterium]|nr:CAP domain-containing protein [Steroidobacteraceae bacterium]
MTLPLVVLAWGCVETPSVAGHAGTVTPQVTPAARSATPVTEPAAVAGITAAHNRVRARVGVPPLKWNPQLAEVARRWANACVDRDAARGMLDHSSGRSDLFPGPLGENLHATTAPVANPVEAVEDWAGEARDYDYDRNACRDGAMCGHYTQVVWRTTREVGCAVGSCPRLRFRGTLVCNYWPAGNWVGERPY